MTTVPLQFEMDTEALSWVSDESLEYVPLDYEEEIESKTWHSERDYSGRRFRKLLERIGRAADISNLKDNWDGEGAVGYSITTINRAIHFVQNMAQLAWDKFAAPLEIPSIGPADSGSIDVYWAYEGKTLLINIPAESHLLATYYGEAQNGNSISGEANIESDRADLVAWLALT